MAEAETSGPIDASQPANEAEWTLEPAPAMARPGTEAALIIDVDGFEGPLDLLLTLARNQKVDLSKISILALAEQYLAFVEAARRLRLELAADYLVMAAWLAYLKSRLLLPDPQDDGEEPTAQELAGMLAFRLQRLEAMRDAAARLVARSRLGRDVHARGNPEPVAIARQNDWQATLYDLLAAYAAQRQKQIISRVHVRRRKVWALSDAREILTRLIGRSLDWSPVESFLSAYLTDPEMRPTVRASTFSAVLELVREGKLEMRQSEPFAPLYLRAGSGRPDVGEIDGGSR